jgi:WD40 repeat protein
VRVWDPKSERAIGESLRGLQGVVRAAVFRTDGSRIVSAGEDGTVRILPPVWSDPISHFCILFRDHQSLAALTSDAPREAKWACQRGRWP